MESRNNGKLPDIVYPQQTFFFISNRKREILNTLCEREKTDSIGVNDSQIKTFSKKCRKYIQDISCLGFPNLVLKMA